MSKLECPILKKHGIKYDGGNVSSQDQWWIKKYCICDKCIYDEPKYFSMTPEWFCNYEIEAGYTEKKPQTKETT